MTKGPATIRDVAKAAGLSVASVSRVMNGHKNVHPQSRDKVLKAMADLGYSPNAAARSLSTAKSHAIGVVLPDLYGEFFGELVRGMDMAASANGYLLLLSNMHADLRQADQAMGAMRGRVDGLVVMAPQLSPDDLAKALPAGLPTVLVNSPASGQQHSLKIDNRGGTMLILRHLLAGGCKRIVHIAAMADNLDGAERCQAYREVMAQLAPDLPVRVIEGDFTEATAERLVSKLLADGEPFDGIYAANDMMALGALQALKAVGISVPGDVAVAGFDDVPLARYLGLTTVRADMVGIGERAIMRLLEEIEGNEPSPQIELFTPTLVPRTTTRAV